MTQIAVLDDYQRVALDLADWSLLPDGFEVTVFDDHLEDEAAVAARLAEFDVVVMNRERTPFRRSLLTKLPKLKLLVTNGRRNFSIDLEAAAEQGITVSGTRVLPNGTAELTWGLILGLARHIPAEDRHMRAGGWQMTMGGDLADSCLGVIGVGRMGVQVARIGLAFGMKVIAWSPNLTAEKASAAGAILVGKDELFAQSDFVTLHLVPGSRNRGIVGAREFGLMKKTAFLINTSRGPLVEEAAMIAALDGGEIAGAGLDVYDREPLPPDHPLRSIENTILTPHLGYVTEDNYRLGFAEAIEDIIAWANGAPVRVLEAG